MVNEITITLEIPEDTLDRAHRRLAAKQPAVTLTENESPKEYVLDELTWNWDPAYASGSNG